MFEFNPEIYARPACFMLDLGESVRKASATETKPLRTIVMPSRRGLSADEAAHYAGVGKSKFLEMAGDGRMPRPARIDRRTVWDIRALDKELDDLFEARQAQTNADDVLDDQWGDEPL